MGVPAGDVQCGGGSAVASEARAAGRLAQGVLACIEEREAQAQARCKAEAAVVRAEEKVISGLLGSMGMREEHQLQARRMKQMAYDGIPGPGEWLVCICVYTVLMHAAAELWGLMYKFNWFLYLLMQPKLIVEKTVQRWDEEWHEWVEEVRHKEVYAERKKLFNFVKD